MTSTKSQISPELWKKIKRAHTARKKSQPNLIRETEMWKLEVERKLAIIDRDSDGVIQSEKWFVNFFRCGREEGYVMCASCGHGRRAPYRCSQKWCPECNWRVSMRRKELMEEITKGMPQLKHVVLTQRNFENLTPEKIDESRAALFKLRRLKLFEKKMSGCASLEFTNEKAGWHLHWHLLVTQKWVDASKLAVTWGELLGQEFAIVKVKALDGEAYLQEILKYVVKGNEFAKWSPERILQFIRVIRTKRCFATFGKFRQIAKFAREFIKAKKLPCGCPDCGSVELVHGSSESDCSGMIDRFYGGE